MSERPGLFGLVFYYAPVQKKVSEKSFFLCPNPQVNRDIIVNDDRCDSISVLADDRRRTAQMEIQVRQ